MSIINIIANKILATDKVRVDESSHGFQFLHKAFLELEKRLEATPVEKKAHAELALMRASMASAIELAYTDWAAFVSQWECIVAFHGHVEKSNIFVFSFKEKNSCPRSYEFRFTGLKNSI